MMNIAPIRIRTPLLMFSLLFTMWSCGEDSDSQRFPGEDFAVAGAVRVTSPANGDTLESPFTVQFTTAEGVDSVRLEAGGATINTADAATAEMIVELDEGRVGLRLIGMDENGDDLSDHSIGVKVVAAEEPWVTITSPADGAEVTNPVTFALTASEDIDLITIEADGWELGSVNPDDTLTYTFTNTDEIRDILATGWTTEEEPVASDEIEITVIEGRAKFFIRPSESIVM